MKQDDDNRLTRMAEEQEHIRQEQQRQAVRARLASLSAKFARYSTDMQEKGKLSKVMTLEAATALLRDEGLLGEGEGSVPAEGVRSLVAASSPLRGRQGGNMLNVREFRRFVTLLCQRLHQPPQACLEIAVRAESFSAQQTAEAAPSAATGKANPQSTTAASPFARALSAQSAGPARPNTAQSAVAKLRNAVRLSVAAQEASERTRERLQRVASYRPNPLLTPAPHPGTYRGPFTLRWPHPAPVSTVFTVSDQYPLFRKHLRDSAHLQQAPARVRHYSAREHGPCHPAMQKGHQKQRWEAAPAGYYRQAGGIGRFLCTVCGRAFVSTSVLQAHYKTHTHAAAEARSRLPPPPSPDSSASSIDLLAPSGRTTPSSLGGWDLTYDALDDVPSRGRNALLGGARHPGQMEFWWQKVKVQLEEALEAASDEQLDDMVLGLLGVDLPYDSDYEEDHEDDFAPPPRLRAAARRGAGRHLPGGNDFRPRPDIAAPVRDAIMVYFLRCVELRTAPNDHLLAHMRALSTTDACRERAPVRASPGALGKSCVRGEKARDTPVVGAEGDWGLRGLDDDEVGRREMQGEGLLLEGEGAGEVSEEARSGEEESVGGEGGSMGRGEYGFGRSGGGVMPGDAIATSVAAEVAARERGKQTLRLAGCLFPR